MVKYKIQTILVLPWSTWAMMAILRSFSIKGCTSGIAGGAKGARSIHYPGLTGRYLGSVFLTRRCNRTALEQGIPTGRSRAPQAHQAIE